MSKRAEERAMEAYPPSVNEHSVEEGFDWNEEYRDVFQQGYEVAEKDVIERACRWLLDNYDNYFDEDGRTTSTLNEFMVGDFRRAMEE